MTRCVRLELGVGVECEAHKCASHSTCRIGTCYNNYSYRFDTDTLVIKMLDGLMQSLWEKPTISRQHSQHHWTAGGEMEYEASGWRCPRHS